MVGRKIVRENVSLDKKRGTNSRAKMKAAHTGKDFKLDDGDGNGKVSKSKTNPKMKQLNMNQNIYVGKSGRTRFQDKKSLLDDSKTTPDDRPKKKKRVIRIDPHDFTNKRMDDAKVTSGQYHSNLVYSFSISVSIVSI